MLAGIISQIAGQSSQSNYAQNESTSRIPILHKGTLKPAQSLSETKSILIGLPISAPMRQQKPRPKAWMIPELIMTVAAHASVPDQISMAHVCSVWYHAVGTQAVHQHRLKRMLFLDHWPNLQIGSDCTMQQTAENGSHLIHAAMNRHIQYLLHKDQKEIRAFLRSALHIEEHKRDQISNHLIIKLVEIKGLQQATREDTLLGMVLLGVSIIMGGALAWRIQKDYSQGMLHAHDDHWEYVGRGYVRTRPQDYHNTWKQEVFNIKRDSDISHSLSSRQLGACQLMFLIFLCSYGGLCGFRRILLGASRKKIGNDYLHLLNI
jgi:hypothetical protein